MGKTSFASKNKYNAKVYDQLPIRVPKGKRALIDQFARSQGKSVNGMVNEMLYNAMGISEEEWKQRTPPNKSGIQNTP